MVVVNVEPFRRGRIIRSGFTIVGDGGFAMSGRMVSRWWVTHRVCEASF